METGETFSEPVEPGDTLTDLKKKIFKSHNFPPVTQYFRFCDRNITKEEGESTLEHLGIEVGSRVYLTVWTA